MNNKKTIVLALAGCFLIVLALLVFSGPVKPAQADTADNSLHGYLWSSNIGWVSLNGASYKVVKNTNGSLQGYGWSPSLGWLRFGADLTGPSGGGDNWGAKIDGNKITGWARFCSVYVSGCSGQEKNLDGTELGGWSGWVKMNGAHYGVTMTLADTASAFTGYTWGDLNTGWLSFGAHGRGDGGTPINPPGGNCNPAIEVCGGGGGPTCFPPNKICSDGQCKASCDVIPPPCPLPNKFCQTDGLCESPDKCPVADCSFSFVGNNKSIGYYRDPQYNLNPNNKIEINVVCSKPVSSLTANDLNSGFDLTCSVDGSKNSFSADKCSQLISGKVWVWVIPKNTPPPTGSVSKNLFYLVLNGLDSSKQLARFDYYITAGN